MPDLPGHDGPAHALALKSLDQLREFPQRKPVNGEGAVRLDIGKSFFLDGGNHDLVSLSPCRVQHEKGKLAIAGDQTQFFVRKGHEVDMRQTRGVSLALGIKRRSKDWNAKRGKGAG